MPPKPSSTSDNTHTPPPPIVRDFKRVMPSVVSAVRTAAHILGVDPDSLITYRQTETGGVVVITGPGQKFTFTAEQIADPDLTRQRLKIGGVKVIK